MMFTRERIIEAKEKTQVKWEKIKDAKDIDEMDAICGWVKCSFCLLFLCVLCILNDKNRRCCKEHEKWRKHSKRVRKNIIWVKCWRKKRSFKQAKYWANKLYLRIKNIDIDEALELANRKKEK